MWVCNYFFGNFKLGHCRGMVVCGDVYNTGINICSMLKGFEFFVFSICQKQTKPDVIKCVNKSSVRSQLFSRAATGTGKYMHIISAAESNRDVANRLPSFSHQVCSRPTKNTLVKPRGKNYLDGQCSGNNHHESEFYLHFGVYV